MTPVGVPKPPMGTGHFPDDDSLLIHACYFRDVAFQNASRQEDYPLLYLTQFYQNAPCNCYHIGIYEFPENSDQFGGFAGSFIQFGGPGGDCGNDNFLKLFGLVCVIIIMVFVIIFFLICLRAYLHKSSGSCCDVVAGKL
ncbi:uncharacterized protein LOC131615780 [Vicia villosa]|uniref:uncharacterized protein LOC131615780 n=1 Tax=Vicia villosa TaxID=3911 RepID=UPI00273CF2FB|nr:uncharacterized protein LOC131615780 [Vicia villosa]